MIQVRLFNGSKTRVAYNPESPEFIDDWKPEERFLLADWVVLTYGGTLRIGLPNDDVLHLVWYDDGLMHYDKVYCGDVSISDDSEL